MGLQEQQNFLARIFTDESLRLSFWENPEIVGTENGLNQTEIKNFKEIVANDLNHFADSLFYKRLHEVENLLPLTGKYLNNDFTETFHRFAQNFQPTGVRKHLEDAIEFCKFLQKSERSQISDAAKFEQTKHEFFYRKKIFSFCILQTDIFGLQKRFCLAVWYRTGSETHHFIL